MPAVHGANFVKLDEGELMKKQPPVKKTEPDLTTVTNREAECSFDDIFAAPTRLTPPEVDSAYLHRKKGIFSRLFGKRDPEDRQKVA